MTSTDAALAHNFDPSDPDTVIDPYPAYAALRQQCPVAHFDTCDGFWMLSTYDAVQQVANRPVLFSSNGGATFPPVGNPIRAIPLEIDPPEHGRYRTLLQPWFSPGAVAKLTDGIRAITRGLLDGFAGRGEGDLVHELANPLPSMVIAKMMGFPESDWEKFRHLADRMCETSRVMDRAANFEAAMNVFAYLSGEVNRRRETPLDDMITQLMNTEVDGALMPDDVLLGMIFFVWIAGHETTVGGIGFMLWYLGTHPEVKQRVLADRSLIPAVVEETLRLGSPVNHVMRTTTEDTEVGGCPIPAGERVVLSWGSANRDAAVFPDPDELRIDRHPNRHLAFGYGVHRCLGAPLAQLELRVVLEEVLMRMPDFELAAGSAVKIDGIQARAVRTLPATW